MFTLSASKYPFRLSGIHYPVKELQINRVEKPKHIPESAMIEAACRVLDWLIQETLDNFSYACFYASLEKSQRHIKFYSLFHSGSSNRISAAHLDAFN